MDPLLGNDSDRLIGANRQHMGNLLLLQPHPQVRVAAVRAISDHPSKRQARLSRTHNHRLGELGLGGKPHLSRDTRLLAPLVVSHPFSRQIQFPIEEGGANGADIAEKNADLTILHLLGTWVVLPLDSNRVLTSFGKPGVIKS